MKCFFTHAYVRYCFDNLCYIYAFLCVFVCMDIWVFCDDIQCFYIVFIMTNGGRILKIIIWTCGLLVNIPTILLHANIKLLKLEVWPPNKKKAFFWTFIHIIQLFTEFAQLLWRLIRLTEFFKILALYVSTYGAWIWQNTKWQDEHVVRWISFSLDYFSW